MRTVEYVVIHDIEGTAQGCIRWFQDPRAKASSHYVVDGETGKVWQMVKERDVAWHAGNLDINRRSVGIEHHGYAYRPGFYDSTLYEASARLVRDITARYNIPRDRKHIIAHSEVPDPTDPTKFGGRSHHTDPGPYWDWDTLMCLVRNDARLDGTTFPAVLRPGERAEVSVTFLNLGDDPWPVPATGASGGDESRIAFAKREPVYLGVWPAPTGLLAPQQGSLYAPTWNSPRFVGLPAAETDVAPGTAARFVFTVRAPAVAGETVQQSFRLNRVPVAPRPPVPFGPVVTASVRVEPWDITVGADALAAAAPWQRNGALWWSKATPEAARWTATLPLGGEWEVYARWPAAEGRTGRATYAVTTADGGVGSVVVDQREAPGGEGGWRRLGRFSLGRPGVRDQRAEVRLTATGPGTVVADGLRFVGPFAPGQPR